MTASQFAPLDTSKGTKGLIPLTQQAIQNCQGWKYYADPFCWLTGYGPSAMEQAAQFQSLPEPPPPSIPVGYVPSTDPTNVPSVDQTIAEQSQTQKEQTQQFFAQQPYVPDTSVGAGGCSLSNLSACFPNLSGIWTPLLVGVAVIAIAGLAFATGPEFVREG